MSNERSFLDRGDGLPVFFNREYALHGLKMWLRAEKTEREIGAAVKSMVRDWKTS